MGAAMSADIGNTRRYETLCRVLDSLCNEAPSAARIYHPPPGDQEKLIQARSRALLHLFLKARFGLLNFATRENCVTDGPNDAGTDVTSSMKAQNQSMFYSRNFERHLEIFLAATSP